MTPEQFERERRHTETALQVAIGAYRAVWDTWADLNAGTVEQCRRVAMTAALAAVHGLDPNK